MGMRRLFNEQEIVCVSFHEPGGVGIEDDEDDMPWLELAYLNGTA